MTRWYHSLAFAFGAATFLVAQPIFSFVQANPDTLQVSAPALLWVVVFYQVVPTAVLFTVDRLLVRWSRLLTAWRIVLFYCVVLAPLVMARESPFVHLHWWWLFAASTVFYWGMVVLVGRRLYTVAIAVAIVSLIPTAVFAYNTHLSSRPWSTAPQEARTSDDSLPPVVILVFDGMEGSTPLQYPNFAAFAQDAAVFDATTNYGNTVFSFKSFLNSEWVPTSLLGVDDDLTGIPGATGTGLLVQLRQAGYRVAVYTESFKCNGEEIACDDRAQTIKRHPYLMAGEVGLEWFAYQALPDDWVWQWFFYPFPDHAYTLAQWHDFLSDLSENGQGSAYLVHLQFPHMPYEYDVHGYQGWKPTGIVFAQADIGRIEAGYPKQVEWTDRLLGEMLSVLRDGDWYDASTVVLTADHGPIGVEEGRVGQSPPVLDGISTSVPFLLKSPNVDPDQVYGAYQHIDMAPTILDALGLEIPQGYRGDSALDGGLTQERVYRRVYDREFRLQTFVYTLKSDTWRLIHKY